MVVVVVVCECVIDLTRPLTKFIMPHVWQINRNLMGHGACMQLNGYVEYMGILCVLCG